VRLIVSPTVVLLLVVAYSVGAQTATSREMLVAHNQARADVGVPPLEWSQQLAAVAQQWANELAGSGKFTHRPKGRYGENLFEMRGARANPAELVAGWAGEAEDYDATRNACRTGKVCGHFTQLVWRNTTKMGCGVARRGAREVWVCNYYPPGNWVGERPY
jgi:pathogenesis-related protein 1